MSKINAIFISSTQDWPLWLYLNIELVVLCWFQPSSVFVKIANDNSTTVDVWCSEEEEVISKPVPFGLMKALYTGLHVKFMFAVWYAVFSVAIVVSQFGCAPHMPMKSVLLLYVHWAVPQTIGDAQSMFVLAYCMFCIVNWGCCGHVVVDGMVLDANMPIQQFAASVWLIVKSKPIAIVVWNIVMLLDASGFWGLHK